MNVNMNDWVESYLKSLRVAGKSEHTVLNYEKDLAGVWAFVMNIDPSLTWQGVDHAILQEFVMSRTQGGIASSSLKRQLSAVRGFYRYLIQQNKVKTNPAKQVKTPKQPKPLPKSVDVDITNQLLDVKLESWTDYRNQAIFELLYSAGLRVSEVAGLDVSPGLDDLKNGWVRVLGKGNKERQAPVGKAAKKAVVDWLKLRPLHANKEECALFVNRFGNRLSVRSIQKALDERALKTQVPTKMSPHRLRHACATHVLESSSDLRAVQELLGHANLSTTQIYTKLDMQHLAKVYDAAHPRAKK